MNDCMPSRVILKETAGLSTRHRVVLYPNGAVETKFWAEGLGWRTVSRRPKWWGRLFHRRSLALFSAPCTICAA